MQELPVGEGYFEIDRMFSATYSQLAENKQKNLLAKFFQLSNSLTFAFPKFGGSSLLSFLLQNQAGTSRKKGCLLISRNSSVGRATDL